MSFDYGNLINAFAEVSFCLFGAPFNWDGKIFFVGEHYGDMIGDKFKTCLECISVTIKCLDGKILNYIKIIF